MDMLNNCNLCGRKCGINRNLHKGLCNSDNKINIARAELHFGEEPCISGDNGSGTVFFSNCNLRCVFCQNHCISQEGKGKEVSIERLSDIFLELQNKGANNINLVTPTHYVPQIIEALKISKKKNLKLPVVYNSNGYDSIETIKSLEGLIDIYIPDLKYFDNKYANKYSDAKDYFNVATKAIEAMYNQVGKSQFHSNGIMKKGIIIRHLMLPGLLFDSKKVIDYTYKKYKDDVFISIMNQYTPMHRSKEFSEINKPLNPKHYDSLIQYALDIGVTNAFIQESGTNSECFVPDFNFQGL